MPAVFYGMCIVDSVFDKCYDGKNTHIGSSNRERQITVGANRYRGGNSSQEEDLSGSVRGRTKLVRPRF